MLLSKKLVMYVCISLIGLTAGAQEEKDFITSATDFLPPAPDAAAIAKAGLFNINKNTGAPILNIPLMSVKGIKANVDISLTYATSGIRVDEIASRVGMGWTLNAGGMVSRTVRGFTDEDHTRIAPWQMIGMAGSATFNFCRNVLTYSNNAGGYDNEPDYFTFNFNGHSGAFILDHQMKPVLVPGGNYKIELDGLEQEEITKITITTDDGVVYTFGGETGTVEKTKTISNCIKDHSTPVATSWVLTSIEYPNTEIVEFNYYTKETTYEMGLNETLTQTQHSVAECLGDGATSETENCEVVKQQYTPTEMTSSISSCANIHHSATAQLLSIRIDNKIEVVFGYRTRPDYDDDLVESIKYKKLLDEGPAVTFKQYFLSYQMEDYNGGPGNTYINTASILKETPYLVSVNEYGSSTLESPLSYSFSYIDPSGRCPRLSYAQDHWGYFNGKYNTTLIPVPEAELEHSIPIANSDREPDFEYAQKGMLNKIVYPTGGIEQIIYEPNTVAVTKEEGVPYEYACSVYGVDELPQLAEPTEKTITFSTNHVQDVQIDYTYVRPGTIPEETLNAFLGFIEVRNTVTNSLIESLPLGIGANSTLTLADLPAGNYSVKMIAKEGATTSINLKYKPDLHTVEYEKQSGGVRVKEVLKGNRNELPVVTKYFYGDLEHLNRSSNRGYHKPKYEQAYTIKRHYSHMSTGFGGFNWDLNISTDYFGMHSGSLSNLFAATGSNTSYEYVLESKGENFENGGIYTKYEIAEDEVGSPILGTAIINCTQPNSSILGNGKIVEEQILKRGNSGQLFPLKKTVNVYEFDDERTSKELTIHLVRQHHYDYNLRLPVDTNCGTTMCLGDWANATNLYDIQTYAIYSPWTHINQTTETLYDENGQNPQVNVVNYFYDDERNHMVTRISTTDSKGATITTTNTYPHDYPGEAPYTGMVATNYITPVITTSVTKESHGSNITLSDVKYNYQLWEAFTGSGGKYFDVHTVESSVKTMPLQLQATISRRDEYGNIIEYNGKDEIINSVLWGYGQLYPVAKITGIEYSAVLDLLGITVGELQALRGTDLENRLAYLRGVLPASATLTAYTYDPYIGVNTIFDINGKKNRYDYDNFGRLKTIKDNDDHLAKSIDYTYAGPGEEGQLTLYWNEDMTIDVSCSSCGAGTRGIVQHIYIPPHTYFSLSGVQDANDKAIAATQAKAQQSPSWKCTNASQLCTGEGYAMIGCNCEQGVFSCVGKSLNPNGSYTFTYHYTFSDNSHSETYGPKTLPYDPCPNE